MDTSTHSHVLLKTVAQAANAYPQSHPPGHQDAHRCASWIKFKRPLSLGANTGHAIGDDQQVAGITGARLGEGTVDQVSLCLTNRPVRTRMSGGVGTGG